MTSIYYTPPVPLVPNTTAQSGVLNNDFSVGVDNAFIAVAADVAKRLAHATLTLGALVGVAGALAGKILGINGAGTVLAIGPSFGTWRGLWATGTSYNAGDVIQDNISHALYYALAAYVGGGTSAAQDAVNGHLVQISNAPPSSPLPVTNQTTSFTAVAGNAYLVASSAAPIIMRLPTSASSVVGDLVELVTQADVAFTVTAAPQGADLINGLNANALIYNLGLCRGARFVYTGPTFGWVIMWVH